MLHGKTRKTVTKNCLKRIFKLSEFDIESTPKHFTNIFIDILNLYPPLKKKYLRANHSKLNFKDLSTEIMLRFKLRNKFLKDKTNGARAKYRKNVTFVLTCFLLT